MLIADFKDQLSNRARTKGLKGDEQHVLVQVSARITADRRSISSCSGRVRVAGCFRFWRERLSVNSASGVIARKLSNKLKDLAAVAEMQQDVSHVFGWSHEERLGVQIGWYCYAVDIRRCEDNRHAESKM